MIMPGMWDLDGNGSGWFNEIKVQGGERKCQLIYTITHTHKQTCRRWF